MKTFGEFVFEARKAAGLGQKQVAALGGKSAAFVSDIEAGNRFPNTDSMPALAEVLQVDLATLKLYDPRGLAQELKSFLLVSPQSAKPLRLLISRVWDIGADEVLRRVERGV